MASVTSLTASVHQRLADALAAALPEAGAADPLLRRSDRADYQANGILALAKKLKGNPRELATKVVDAIGADEVIQDIEVSGPGFLNLTLSDAAITRNLAPASPFPPTTLPAPRVGASVTGHARSGTAPPGTLAP